MEAIQLLLEDQQNRQLLADALDGDYEVVDGVHSADSFLKTEFDLCIVDGPAFRSHRETLVEKKERASPVFLPYLLLLGGRSPDRAAESVWEHVDEVIDTPIARAKLTNRVSNLLQRRELSLELKREQEFTEERFQTLFESTPDPIVVVTDDGIITEVNDAFARLFDIDRSAVLGTHVTDIDVTAVESVERLLLRVTDAASTDSTETENTVTIKSSEGDTYVTELNVDVVEELGDATERIGIFRDVTGREEYQRQLERQIEQLERFASVISHDLRDPLNTAQAKVRLAQRDCDSEKLDELLEVHGRMETLIEDVLMLAKQGKVAGETEPVDLNEAVDLAWATVGAPDTATLQTADPPLVKADDERLRALLENLFRNAVMHGGPEVTLSVGPLTEHRGFYVADDGPGIPEEERADVFEYGHTTAAEGTGLGLSIVQSIAEAHGWAVSVTESDTGGARFEVTTET
ncbi:two-component system sensor histidine kinase NtrB [Halovenus marina]|uniref:two-component system sensor histidine kinase NtrB n=1 Tax=Halovenus marina TaxID=3396621 RepID=UPI003F56F505